MAKTIKVFKSFEEQEMCLLEYFAKLTPSERLQELARLQKKNKIYTDAIPVKVITVKKHFVYGH